MKHIILLLFMLFVYGSSFTQTKPPENNSKLPTSFFIGVGVAFNSFAVTGDDSYHETQIEHTVPISPAFVVGAKLYAGNKTSRLFLAPRISVYSFSAKGKIDLTSGIATYQHASSFQSKIVITPSFNLGYHFINKSNLKWHISAGIGFDFLINPSETQTTTYTSAPPRIVENKPNPMVFVFSMGTGIDIGKNINIWLNYQPPADITKYINKKSKLSSLQIGVSWSFSKGN
ncbi:MAG: hypothetical protein ABL927_04390 [Bdellovibrionales bacterium]